MPLMSRSNISHMKMRAIQLISRKAKLERRIKNLEVELNDTIRALDSSVKQIAEIENKTTEVK